MAESDWVFRGDGTIQCENKKEESLEEAARQLATIIGQDNIINAEKRSIPVIRLCGFPTGQVNAFELSPQGMYILFHGIVGPIGFRKWIADDAGMLSKGGEQGGEVPYPFQQLARLTPKDVEARGFPVGPRPMGCDSPATLEELYGRDCRVYTLGDALTTDFVDGRVNIGLNGQRRVAEIWFG